MVADDGEVVVLRRRVMELERAQGELQRVEEALRQSEQHTQRILESVPGGVVQVDMQGAIVLANRPAQQFLGLSYDQLSRKFIVDFAGRTWFENGEPAPVDAYPVARCLATGEAHGPVTLGVEQPCGETRWAMFSAFPLRGPGGQYGAVVTLFDITARKQVEEQRAVMQEKLLMADRLTTVGTLAAGVAHEINNPLTYVLGNLALLQETLAETNPPDALRTIGELSARAMEGAERMRKIVSDLRTFSRAGDDGVAHPVDVCRAMDSAVNMCIHDIRQHATLESRGAQRLYTLGHEARLCQVFVNLLINATQALPPGRCSAHRITVSMEALDDVTLRIRVQDTGPGIAPEVLPRIFDPFFTTKPVGVGTGLGLAISRSIVTGMHGRISVHNVDGGGAAFDVELPLIQPPQDTRKSTPPHAAMPSRRARILVVDDEPDVITLLQRALGDHDVVTAGSGAAAVTLLGQQAFDVILCDVMMPGMDGVQLHEHVRRHQPGLSARFIFMTAGAFSTSLRDQMDALGCLRIEKPFDVHTVRALVAEQVGGTP